MSGVEPWRPLLVEGRAIPFRRALRRRSCGSQEDRHIAIVSSDLQHLHVVDLALEPMSRSNDRIEGRGSSIVAFDGFAT
jgi:hypothetical protein